MVAEQSKLQNKAFRKHTGGKFKREFDAGRGIPSRGLRAF